MSDKLDYPDPLTPPDCDLRGMPYMPLDIVRLFDSDFYAISTGDEFKAGLTLWGRSFLQVPAGSLPNDDRILAYLSGAGRAWSRLRDVAMRGWVRCSDGRLYHPVIAAKAIEAWQKRTAFRERTKNATEARKQRREQRDVDRPDNVTSTKGKGKGKGKGKRTSKKERTPQPPKGGVDIPDWIPKQAWSAYIASRVALGKTPTDEAISRTLAKLDGYRHRGLSVEDALNNAVEHGWTGVFEPRPSNGSLPLASPVNGASRGTYDIRYFSPSKPEDIAALPEPERLSQEWHAWRFTQSTMLSTAPPEGYRPRSESR